MLNAQSREYHNTFLEDEPNLKNRIIIVGAGWAGLSAALALKRQGQSVLLLEASPQAGGRARSIAFGDYLVDNGQHLLIGAYENCLTLLNWLNIAEERFFYRMPLELLMVSANHSKNNSTLLHSLHFKAKNPLSFLKNLKLLGIKEMYQFIKVIGSIKNNLVSINEDISVYQWLKLQNQSEKIIQMIWEPILLAALSTPIKEASSQVAIFILKKLFSEPGYSDYLFPKKDLSEILPNQIVQFLDNLDNPETSKILYRTRVKSLMIENGRCIGVQTDTENILGTQVILATPMHVTGQLLNSSSQSAQPLANKPDFKFPSITFPNLDKFKTDHYQSIATLYLRYAKPVNLKAPMIGLVNGIGHWIFDRKIANQPDLLSVVITGNGKYLDLEKNQLIKQIVQEIKMLVPKITDKTYHPHKSILQDDPIDYRLITEKQAAFSCRVGIENDRPSQITALPNVWLAGDYTQAGYPATLEAAVQSGILAAKLLLY